MSQPDIIVIGASTGGHLALQEILSHLPATFPVPICIAMHIGNYDSRLEQILQTRSELAVRYAADGEPLQAGSVLLAPPDRHLLVQDGGVKLSRGAKENFARPAIDPLFRSAAFYYREKAVGIILSGHLDDGTVGLLAIKACGGIAIAQDPDEAEATGMPCSAIEHVQIDYCLPLRGIADKLLHLQDFHSISVPPPVWIPSEIKMLEDPSMEELDRIGRSSKMTCPLCQGALWEIDQSGFTGYRCHTGHAFTQNSLSAGQNEVFEEAVWSAVRALHEKQRLLKRMADSAATDTNQQNAQEYLASAQQAIQHAKILRAMVTSANPDMTQSASTSAVGEQL